jgi:hypothetical protein
MVSVINSGSHFVPLGKVLEVPLSSSVGSATERMKGGGLIALAASTTAYYLTSSYIKRSAMHVLQIAPELRRDLKLADLIRYTLQPSIGASLSTRNPWDFVPIAAEPIQVDADESPYGEGNRPFLVYSVVDASRRQVGWFFNHEQLQGTINTPPEVWVCVLGHSNADYDSGHCKSCPNPLVR